MYLVNKNVLYKSFIICGVASFTSDILCIQPRNEYIAGADPGFQTRGCALENNRAERKRGANIFGVFRVKNQDLKKKYIYIFQF